ncbi:MAG: hypothetical protein H0V79_04870 [Actinobacteria bacterium]|nr:hypothetical protein [Actinomycetota bacterium]
MEPTYVELNPPVSLSRLGVSTMAADAFSDQPTAFRLMPSLSYTGTRDYGDNPYELYRTYITTDVDW